MYCNRCGTRKEKDLHICARFEVTIDDKTEIWRKTLDEDVVQEKIKNIVNMNDLVFRLHEEDIFQAQLQKKKDDYVEEFTKHLKGLEAYFEIGIGPMEHFKHGFIFTPITKGFPIMQHKRPQQSRKSKFTRHS
ncbi:hypothetical protein ACHQM5_001214 [Ranunculus cassubicifolius]